MNDNLKKESDDHDLRNSETMLNKEDIREIFDKEEDIKQEDNYSILEYKNLAASNDLKEVIIPVESKKLKQIDTKFSFMNERIDSLIEFMGQTKENVLENIFNIERSSLHKLSNQLKMYSQNKCSSCNKIIEDNLVSKNAYKDNSDNFSDSSETETMKQIKALAYSGNLDEDLKLETALLEKFPQLRQSENLELDPLTKLDNKKAEEYITGMDEDIEYIRNLIKDFKTPTKKPEKLNISLSDCKRLLSAFWKSSNCIQHTENYVICSNLNKDQEIKENKDDDFEFIQIDINKQNLVQAQRNTSRAVMANNQQVCNINRKEINIGTPKPQVSMKLNAEHINYKIENNQLFFDNTYKTKFFDLKISNDNSKQGIEILSQAKKDIADYSKHQFTEDREKGFNLNKTKIDKVLEYFEILRTEYVKKFEALSISNINITNYFSIISHKNIKYEIERTSKYELLGLSKSSFNKIIISKNNSVQLNSKFQVKKPSNVNESLRKIRLSNFTVYSTINNKNDKNDIVNLLNSQINNLGELIKNANSSLLDEVQKIKLSTHGNNNKENQDDYLIIHITNIFNEKNSQESKNNEKNNIDKRKTETPESLLQSPYTNTNTISNNINKEISNTSLTTSKFNTTSDYKVKTINKEKLDLLKSNIENNIDSNENEISSNDRNTNGTSSNIPKYTSKQEILMGYKNKLLEFITTSNIKTDSNINNIADKHEYNEIPKELNGFQKIKQKISNNNSNDNNEDSLNHIQTSPMIKYNNSAQKTHNKEKTSTNITFNPPSKIRESTTETQNNDNHIKSTMPNIKLIKKDESSKKICLTKQKQKNNFSNKQSNNSIDDNKNNLFNKQDIFAYSLGDINNPLPCTLEFSNNQNHNDDYLGKQLRSNFDLREDLEKFKRFEKVKSKEFDNHINKIEDATVADRLLKLREEISYFGTFNIKNNNEGGSKVLIKRDLSSQNKSDLDHFDNSDSSILNKHNENEEHQDLYYIDTETNKNIDTIYSRNNKSSKNKKQNSLTNQLSNIKDKSNVASNCPSNEKQSSTNDLINGKNSNTSNFYINPVLSKSYKSFASRNKSQNKHSNMQSENASIQTIKINEFNYSNSKSKNKYKNKNISSQNNMQNFNNLMNNNNINNITNISNLNNISKENNIELSNIESNNQPSEYRNYINFLASKRKNNFDDTPNVNNVNNLNNLNNIINTNTQSTFNFKKSQEKRLYNVDFRSKDIENIDNVRDLQYTHVFLKEKIINENLNSELYGDNVSLYSCISPRNLNNLSINKSKRKENSNVNIEFVKTTLYDLKNIVDKGSKNKSINNKRSKNENLQSLKEIKEYQNKNYKAFFNSKNNKHTNDKSSNNNLKACDLQHNLGIESYKFIKNKSTISDSKNYASRSNNYSTPNNKDLLIELKDEQMFNQVRNRHLLREINSNITSSNYNNNNNNTNNNVSSFFSSSRDKKLSDNQISGINNNNIKPNSFYNSNNSNYNSNLNTNYYTYSSFNKLKNLSSKEKNLNSTTLLNNFNFCSNHTNLINSSNTIEDFVSPINELDQERIKLGNMREDIRQKIRFCK